MATKSTKKTPRKPREPHPVNPVESSRCIACGSTRHDKYQNTVTRQISGVTRDGLPYTHIVWRSCRCSDCGQMRRDKSFENRPAAGAH